MRETVSSLRADRSQSLLLSSNKLKLAVFGANVSGGCSMTSAEGTIKVEWNEGKRIAQAAERAGIEAMIPVARWQGFGGDTNFNHRCFETYTWAAGLAAIAEKIMVFATSHVPTIHPVLAAKAAATIDHISGGWFGLNTVAGWNAEEIAMFHSSQREQDSALLQEAHHVLGLVLYFSGEVVSARAHYEHALALYDPRQRRSAIARYGAEFGVISLPQLAHVLWLLGYLDQALTRSHAALPLAQEIAHPFTTALVWIWDTMLHQFLREARAVQQQAEALITLANEQGFSEASTWGIVQQGWALAIQGQAEEGIKQIHQGLAAARATGTELYRPYSLALLVEAYGKTG